MCTVAQAIRPNNTAAATSTRSLEPTNRTATQTTHNMTEHERLAKRLEELAEQQNKRAMGDVGWNNARDLYRAAELLREAEKRGTDRCFCD